MTTNVSKVGTLAVLAVLVLQACDGGSIQNPGGGGGLPGGGGGSRGGGGINLNLDAQMNVVDTRKADLPGDVLPFGRDDAGNPVCLSILSLGRTGTYSDGTDAFQTFMTTYTRNANLGTVTTMTMLRTYTPLTDELLKKYNVIILQALNDNEDNGFWQYQPDDVAALAKWAEAGGSIIAMSGYGRSSGEVGPLNQLLAFSGISYNKDDTFTTCPDHFCYCVYNTLPFDGWTTDYADFDQITQHLKKVGVFFGRSINCTGSDCQVFAKSATYGNVGVAKVVGKGRVLAWSDEWVTYTSQWGLVDSQFDNPNNPSECAERTPKASFSVPQFWYNVFYWSVPAMQWCFTVTVPPSADPDQQPIF